MNYETILYNTIQGWYEDSPESCRKLGLNDPEFEKKFANEQE